MNKARRLLARTFPRMDVEAPVREFRVVTRGKITKVTARDTVEALKMVDNGEVIDILDLYDPARLTVGGAATRRKNAR